ncbi:hypothetical protein [Pontimicrobium aquaticum]|uniref:Uncharacterized protein n=1 Tax=Pontimicrobium aquaticum TaxID=2565367 RepID=A0A4U0F0Q4_9FLAO|nr:hypothetical protein [Pontimicrobium aquaticum]TJY37808.1 hypothetical protein E5167_00710 [Pontimicrobium aquaticum]
MKLKSLLLLVLINFNYFFSINLIGQNKESFVNAVDIFNPSRVKNVKYKLVLYNQKENALSDIAILDRKISRDTYNQTPIIKITEEYNNNKTNTKTLCYIDLKTLLPLYLEVQSSDTLIKKYNFKKDKILLVEIKNSKEIKKEFNNQTGVFLSNSFSEILQSIDFSKNKRVQFKTFSPEKKPAVFKIKVIDEKDFILPNKQSIETWVLQFTVERSNGEVKSGGYRYIDKKSGKVLAFKTDINSDSFFTYQMNLLEEPFDE